MIFIGIFFPIIVAGGLIGYSLYQKETNYWLAIPTMLVSLVIGYYFTLQISGYDPSALADWYFGISIPYLTVGFVLSYGVYGELSIVGTEKFVAEYKQANAIDNFDSESHEICVELYSGSPNYESEPVYIRGPSNEDGHAMIIAIAWVGIIVMIAYFIWEERHK